MRLIDADAVPQEFWEYEFDGKWRGCTIKDLLDSQPTIESEQRWIPVTERIADYGEEVLTINTDGDYEINHIIDEEDAEWFYDGAVAWMPLPPVYKEKE